MNEIVFFYLNSVAVEYGILMLMLCNVVLQSSTPPSGQSLLRAVDNLSDTQVS
jgi:hypothetical protein